ncbi:hypothetical protein ABID22_002860 [Pontibacter aydingkolensis]
MIIDSLLITYPLLTLAKRGISLVHVIPLLARVRSGFTRADEIYKLHISQPELIISEE